DPKYAIFYFVGHGFWLTIVVFLIRCIESYTIAVDELFWNKRSANVHAWIRTYPPYSEHSFGIKV
ncbi:hypothetical protein MTO96_046145, partial [Rhipicephalus appendiculatus]